MQEVLDRDSYPNPQESSPAIFNAFDRNHIVIGKHYSNNGGVTWKIMNTPDDVTPFRSIVLNPDIIMIVLDKLWISLDGGDTFKLYNVQPTEEMVREHP